MVACFFGKVFRWFFRRGNSLWHLRMHVVQKYRVEIFLRLEHFVHWISMDLILCKWVRVKNKWISEFNARQRVLIRLIYHSDFISSYSHCTRYMVVKRVNTFQFSHLNNDTFLGKRMVSIVYICLKKVVKDPMIDMKVRITFYRLMIIPI